MGHGYAPRRAAVRASPRGVKRLLKGVENGPRGVKRLLKGKMKMPHGLRPDYTGSRLYRRRLAAEFPSTH